MVNDHDFSVTTVAMHYAGHDDFWTYGTSYQKMTSQGYNQTSACVCNEYAAAWEPIYEVNGQRSDGYVIWGLIFQGGRIYDQNVQQWSQPDAYKGTADDPMSQRAYMWNRNNPVAYSDPSGFDPGFDVLPPVVSSGAPSNSGGLSFWNLAGMTIGDLIVLGAPEEAPVEGAIARMATRESITTTGEAAVSATPEDLKTIESHLSRPEFQPDSANGMMIHGLRSSIANGARLTDAYHEFYNHELLESYLYDVFGMNDYPVAHNLALEAYRASPFSLYSPEIIQAFPSDYWNPGYMQFWNQ